MTQEEEEEEKIFVFQRPTNHLNPTFRNVSNAQYYYEDVLVDEVDMRLSAREGSIGRSLHMMRPL
jgi:hypothetical protein